MGDKNLKQIFSEYTLLGIDRQDYPEIKRHTYIMHVEVQKESDVIGVAIEVTPEALETFYWACTPEDLLRWQAEADQRAIEPFPEGTAV